MATVGSPGLRQLVPARLGSGFPRGNGSAGARCSVPGGEPVPMTREQAAAAVAAATAERDGTQENLYDLDGRFGRKRLAGASLVGTTKRRWDVVSAEQASLWESFTAYDAIVSQAAALLGRVRRASSPELGMISDLLTARQCGCHGRLRRCTCGISPTGAAARNSRSPRP